LAYEGFPIEFGLKLGASCPLMRGAGGIADVWMCWITGFVVLVLDLVWLNICLNIWHPL